MSGWRRHANMPSNIQAETLPNARLNRVPPQLVSPLRARIDDVSSLTAQSGSTPARGTSERYLTLCVMVERSAERGP